MATPRKDNPEAVREPAQVYLAADDSTLLARLAEETQLSKAEILRRGIRSFAREQGATTSPMLKFIAESATAHWPDEIAANHDEVLATEYANKTRKRR